MSALEAKAEFFERPKQALSPEQEFQAREAAAGRLTEIVSVDQSGRRISRFYGSPGETWDMFKGPSRLVTGWKQS